MRASFQMVQALNMAPSLQANTSVICAAATLLPVSCSYFFLKVKLNTCPFSRKPKNLTLVLAVSFQFLTSTCLRLTCSYCRSTGACSHNLPVTWTTLRSQEAAVTRSFGTPLSDSLNGAAGLHSVLGLVILAQVNSQYSLHTVMHCFFVLRLWLVWAFFFFPRYTNC